MSGAFDPVMSLERLMVRSSTRASHPSAPPLPSHTPPHLSSQHLHVPSQSKFDITGQSAVSHGEARRASISQRPHPPRPPINPPQPAAISHNLSAHRSCSPLEVLEVFGLPPQGGSPRKRPARSRTHKQNLRHALKVNAAHVITRCFLAFHICHHLLVTRTPSPVVDPPVVDHYSSRPPVTT